MYIHISWESESYSNDCNSSFSNKEITRFFLAQCFYQSIEKLTGVSHRDGGKRSLHRKEYDREESKKKSNGFA